MEDRVPDSPDNAKLRTELNSHHESPQKLKKDSAFDYETGHPDNTAYLRGEMDSCMTKQRFRPIFLPDRMVMAMARVTTPIPPI